MSTYSIKTKDLIRKLKDNAQKQIDLIDQELKKHTLPEKEKGELQKLKSTLLVDIPKYEYDLLQVKAIEECETKEERERDLMKKTTTRISQLENELRETEERMSSLLEQAYNHFSEMLNYRTNIYQKFIDFSITLLSIFIPILTGSLVINSDNPTINVGLLQKIIVIILILVILFLLFSINSIRLINMDKSNKFEVFIRESLESKHEKLASRELEVNQELINLNEQKIKYLNNILGFAKETSIKLESLNIKPGSSTTTKK